MHPVGLLHTRLRCNLVTSLTSTDEVPCRSLPYPAILLRRLREEVECTTAMKWKPASVGVSQGLLCSTHIQLGTQSCVQHRTIIVTSRTSNLQIYRLINLWQRYQPSVLTCPEHLPISALYIQPWPTSSTNGMICKWPCSGPRPTTTSACPLRISQALSRHLDAIKKTCHGSIFLI